MNQLRLSLEPRPKHVSEFSDEWGRLTFAILIGSERIVLLDVRWNVLEFAEWFVEHWTFLCQHKLIIEGDAIAEHENLSQAMNRLYDKDFESQTDFDRWHEKLDELSYWTHHSIHAGFEGAAVPPILIGCNRGQGEISHVERIPDPFKGQGAFVKPGDWQYEIDIADFLRSVSQEMLAYMHRISSTIPASELPRVMKVVQALERFPTDINCCG